MALHPALLDLQRGRLRQFVEIGAGGERRAISGEDDDPGIGALVEAPYVLRQSLAQAHVQGVEHCRAVQSQQGHALLRPLQQHEFGAHRPREESMAISNCSGIELHGAGRAVRVSDADDAAPDQRVDRLGAQSQFRQDFRVSPPSTGGVAR